MPRCLVPLILLVACGRTELVTYDQPIPPPVDAGRDAGVDAGLRDAGLRDAGVDAGRPDAGRFDAGVDAGLPDAGFDAGVRPDAGRVDAGFDAGFDAGPGLAADDIIYLHDSAALYGYLPRTNTFTRIATITCNRPTDLAIDQAGRAFMIAGFTLYRLNLQTGVCTPLATLPELLLTLQFLPAGVVDPTAEGLVGYGPMSYWEFEPATGMAMALGSSDLGFNQIPSGDLTALEDGGAFLTVKDANGGTVCSDCLVRINPQTGAVVERYGPIGVTSVWGLATFDNKLYGFTNQGEAVILDLLGDGGVAARQLGTSPGRAFWGAAARPGAGSARDGG
ncbi:MAG: hypothetical protein GQE15_39085 [Archangiaceae bacterium]|nr:hypothetical protein [Archangiaceae bacterium]